VKLADVRISFHSLEIEISFELQDLGSVSTCTSRLVDIFKVGVDATVAGIGVSVGSGVSVGRWDSVGYGVCVDTSIDSVQAKTNIRLAVSESMNAFIMAKLYHYSARPFTRPFRLTICYAMLQKTPCLATIYYVQLLGVIGDLMIYTQGVGGSSPPSPTINLGTK
jgi:hypothetical protein